jgi:hypothetical protein
VKSLVYLLFLGLVIFAVAGWFLDWYNIGDASNKDGKHHVSLDIDGNKIRQDLNKGEVKLQDTINKIEKEQAAAPDGKSFQRPEQ